MCRSAVKCAIFYTTTYFRVTVIHFEVTPCNDAQDRHHAEKFGVDRKYEQLKLPTKLVTTCKRPKDLWPSFTTF